MTKKLIATSIATFLCFAACKNKEEKTMDNVLMAEWEGPYGGVPAFDKMEISMVQPAIEKGISQHLQEIDSIANNPEDPTFENTIMPFEKSGALLNRVFTYYGVFSSNLSSPEFREVQQKLAPKISEYQSKISQNEPLFKRIKKVYEASQQTPLDSAKQRTLNLIYKDFEMQGANLSKKDKKRYAEINKELSELYTKFSNNVLADEENYVTYLDSTQLDGLPESYIETAANAAEERGEKVKFAVTNTRSSMDPFLTYSNQRKLREKVWRTYYSRGNNGDEFDNNAIIKKILKLRHERVTLLGYDNYAQWRLQDRMAKNPDKAMELMEAVWPAALARVDEEISDMLELAKKQGDTIKTIEAWDYRYYMEKVRQEKYELDSEDIKQYLQLKNLKQAIFYVAGELFNYNFEPISTEEVPVFHPDVSVYKVTDKNSGKLIGLWYLDPYARKGKRSGAWATTYRSRNELQGNKPVLASNNSNFVKPSENSATLLSWDDAETFFHEFGHALHFLSADIKYPTLNSGVRDYTEFQSQLLERWLGTDEVINRFLKHYKTGEPMPKEMVAKIKKAATFNQGFATTEFLASALMDMKYHITNPAKIDNIQDFEKEQLQKLGLPKQIPMRHRSTQFSHIFSSEGYAAGYYGYLWADVLTADAAEYFANSPGGYYDKPTAKKLVKYLFAPRNAMDPAEAYRKFKGEDASIDALMRDRGFPVPKK